MRLDPGNFFLGHPAKKKSEMGSGSGQISEGWEGSEGLEAPEWLDRLGLSGSAGLNYGSDKDSAGSAKPERLGAGGAGEAPALQFLGCFALVERYS